MENFSSPPPLKPADLNLNDILDSKVSCVSGIMLCTFESRSTVSRADGDGELRGHHPETSDVSE